MAAGQAQPGLRGGDGQRSGRDPPEFLRQGRFDDIFFVGLPHKGQREAILKIHLARRGRNPAKFDLASLARAGRGFSGAELEQAVIEGLFRTFDAGRELETGDVAGALNDTYPLSRSRAALIRSLADWGRRFAKPAGREEDRNESAPARV